MPKLSGGLVLGTLILICCSLLLFADSGIEKLESRLTGSTGKERIRILQKLVDAYLIKMPAKALEYGREALALLPSFPDPRQQMILLNGVSKAHSLLGNIQLAEKEALKSQTIAKQLGDKNAEADSLVSRSRIYWDQGNYQLAMKFCIAAEELYKVTGNQKGVASTLKMLGQLNWRLGEPVTALDYELKSTEIYEQLGDRRGMTIVESLIARIYSFQGLYEKALEYNLKALKGYKLLDDENGIAIILNNIGNDYRRTKNYKEALKYLNQASESFREMKSKRAYSYTLNNIGEVYAALNAFRQAQDYFEKSLQLKEEIKDRMGIAFTLINLGKNYRNLGQPEKAIQALLRALNIAAELNIKNEIRNVHKELAETYETLGNYSKALFHQKKYKEINDSIFNEENIKEIVELQTRFETEKKEREIELLKKDKALQKMNLLKQRNLINSLIIILLLIILLALYTRYRLKSKSARALRKEIEYRKRVEAELLKSQKLEAIGILAGGIAHDFNNLLSVIIGNVTMAVEDLENNPKAAKKQLKTVERVCDQASDLSRKLITISTGGWINSRETSLSAILKQTAEYYPEMKPLLWNFSVALDLKSFYGDERQLRQVIYHLLKNAGQATSDPKDIMGHAENIFLDQENDFLLPGGHYVKISITDKGKGIPPEELEKIFVPYFSTNNNVTQKGRGLGLAFCYSIIKKHNGHIAIQSRVGKGTTVDLYLPAYTEDSEASIV
jgi:signal transduction histidine kinase